MSSTLHELAEERLAARTAIERLLLTPVMFELGARPHTPQSLYRAYLQQSHVFVGLYWQSYGWVAPGATFSGLEDEYQLSAGLPRLLYVKEPAERRQARLTQLLDRMERDASASYKVFSTPDELARLLSNDLMLMLTERFEDSAAASGQQAPEVELRLTPPPLPLTGILDRDTEMAGVVRLISSGTRLVTVTGMGGVGKTRLVAEVARRLIPDMPDGVHFVALAALRSRDAVLPYVAESLGIPREGGRGAVDSLADYLGTRQLALVLDNFEHVTAAAPALASLLDRCPGVHALVTSQHTLGIQGETELPLGPLPVPADSATAGAADSPAVQLFAERAAATRGGRRLRAASTFPRRARRHPGTTGRGGPGRRRCAPGSPDTRQRRRHPPTTRSTALEPHPAPSRHPAVTDTCPARHRLRRRAGRRRQGERLRSLRARHRRSASPSPATISPNPTDPAAQS